ncbi:hypothetical protein M115_0590 [Bacteroides fragilis str. 3719 T6]|nr:hypothetical protein M085_0528 [Bacteroides fragilis str. 3986 N(B)19]EYA50177.1 hypothetical protein M115_0590 [Bacteroides fragilis str. 3719 T6]
MDLDRAETVEKIVFGNYIRLNQAEKCYFTFFLFEKYVF